VAPGDTRVDVSRPHRAGCAAKSTAYVEDAAHVDLTERTAEIDGQPVFWRSAPTADGRAPVLYVHGVPTSSDDWVPFLERTGGLAPDLPGFGRSGKGGHLDYSLDGIAAFVERFLDELVPARPERVRLVVHDWGSAALAWAARNPERVERLVVVNAVPLLPGYRWHRIARVWRTPFLGEMAMGLTLRPTMARALRPAFAKPVPAGFLDATMRHFDQGTQRAILRLYRSSPEDALAHAGAGLGRLTCPALVLWPDRDPYIPARFGEAYAAALPAARLVPLPGAGHWPWTGRPEVIETVAAFLADGEVAAAA
jgi:pimeloyl-ACP methyl ester carboxylesterase